MNVLSLFDGMSCGQIALERSGINVDNYYASEVDKYAIKVSTANYPDTKHLGDVQLINYQILPKIDLLIGGSPCQGFSFAGKQLNFSDPRSALFFEFVHALEELKPKYFMLENVVMKKEYQDAISELLGCQPIKINSALVSAQNRNRLYWTNIPEVGQPEDKGITLNDVLEPNLPSCGIGARVVGRKLNELGKRDDYNKDISIAQYLELRVDSKANCMTTVAKDSVVAINNIEGRYQLRGKSKTVRYGGRNSPINSRHEWDFPYIKTDKKLCVKRNQSKASCFTGGANSGGNHSDMDILVIEPDVCRRYSITECERLQTVPDNYTQNKGVSNSQCYKMLGNGWTVDVIAHIFKGLK